MKDQVDKLKQRGIRAARIDSTQKKFENEEILRKVKCGQIQILYITPERFDRE
jgi:ATP-dependent DNA helicase RecQ